MYGISEYIDDTRYVGAWRDNLREGYGMLINGETETSGKWRNDELFTTVKKGINIRSPRIKTKVRMAVEGAIEAANLAAEKSKTALSRGVTARKVAEAAKMAAERAVKCASMARIRAAQFNIKLSETGKSSFFTLKNHTISKSRYVRFSLLMW